MIKFFLIFSFFIFSSLGFTHTTLKLSNIKILACKEANVAESSMSLYYLDIYSLQTLGTVVADTWVADFGLNTAAGAQFLKSFRVNEIYLSESRVAGEKVYYGKGFRLYLDLDFRSHSEGVLSHLFIQTAAHKYQRDFFCYPINTPHSLDPLINY